MPQADKDHQVQFLLAFTITDPYVQVFQNGVKGSFTLYMDSNMQDPHGIIKIIRACTQDLN